MVKVARANYVTIVFARTLKPMNSHFIDTEKGRINYLAWGSGKRLIIALPGFSNSAALFEPIATKLAASCTLVAIDLPFHGRTQWQAEQYSAADVQQWIQAILRRFNVDRFDWMGFSLGGRIILSMIDDMFSHLNSIHLIAPDGLATYRTFYPSLAPQFLRKGLFQMIARYPQKWLRLAKVLHDWHLLDHFSLIYIEKHLRTTIQTERLFKTWLSLPNFPVSKRQSQRILIKQKTPITLNLAIRDKFVNTRAIQGWAKPIPQVRLYLFDEGHHLINGDLGQHFQQVFAEL